MGIITGNGGESDNEANRGVAEMVDVVSLQVLDANGQSVVSDLIATRMLDKAKNLTPDDVKARLMRSARKIQGDSTAVGVGVLDIDAALNETGIMTTSAL